MQVSESIIEKKSKKGMRFGVDQGVIIYWQVEAREVNDRE